MLKLLLKVRLQALIAAFYAGKNGRRNAKLVLAILAVAIPFAFAAFFMLFLSVFRLVAAVSGALGMPWLHFALASAAAVLISLFGSIFSTQSQLFDAKDNELLLSMPIRPRDILLSRLLPLYLLDLPLVLIVMIPAGVAALETFSHTVIGIAVYALFALLLPLLSLAVGCLLGWLLSLLTARVRNKGMVSTVLTLIFLAVYYFVYFRLTDLVANENGGGTAAMMELLPKLEGVFSKLLSPFYWFGKLFADGSVLCGIGAAAVMILPMALAVWLLSRSFFKISLSKSGAKKRIYRQKELHVSGLRWALIKKELKFFSSSAIYMTNCGFGMLVTLAAGVFVLLKREMLSQVLAAMTAMGLPAGFDAFIAVLVLCFLSFSNTMTAPSVSLEGKSRWVAQSIPADLRHVLLAKVDMHLILTAPVLLFASVSAAVCLRFSGLYLVSVLLLPQIVNLLAALAGLWLNLLMPKFDWANEAVPVKQSAPVALLLFGMMLYVMVPAGLYYFLLQKALSPLAMLGIFGAVTLVLCAVLWLWIRKNGGRKFLEAG